MEGPSGEPAPEPKPTEDPPKAPELPKDPPKADPPKAPEPPKDPPKAPEPDPGKFLDHPLIKAEIEKAARLAAKKARDEAEESARLAAERAKMEEADRLRAEKEDADKARAEATTKASENERKAGLYRAILDGKYALQEGSMDFLEYSVNQALAKDPDASIHDVVKGVISKNEFLLEKPAVPALDPVAVAAATESHEPPKKPEATTAPNPKHSQVKTGEKPKEAVDTLNMSAAEYREYKRSLGRS